MEQEYKYFAFISYSSLDYKWGKRIQNKLEHYRMPATLCSEHGWRRNPMRPVFFAPTDIQPGELTAELQERLRASRHLIVVCSPHSARSEWVGKEIAYFHQLGRTQQIHFFIVDGIPNSGNPETECFNPIIKTLGLPEKLGANVHEHIYRLPWLNRERAYVQLITKLLGVEFDSIWQRHRRMLISQVLAWTVGVIALLVSLVLMWVLNQPVDVQLTLHERSVKNTGLPALHDAVVTLTLDNETKADTLASLADKAVFLHVPHRYIGKEIHVTVACPDCLPVDTMVALREDVAVNLTRNPMVYGNIQFKLWSAGEEAYVSNAPITIEGMATQSDAEGVVRLFVPLAKQRREYRLSSTVPLEDSVLYMPYGKDCVILAK